jgi:polysaccharide export outer membrane protein
MTLKFKFKPVLLIVWAALLSLPSCVSYKNIPYFEDLNQSQNVTEDISNFSSHTIQPQDELLIHVTSLNPEASKVFNDNLQTSTINSTVPIYDYLVDRNGEINIPMLGPVKASGLTTDELSAQLEKLLVKYTKEPKVAVRILNFKVAVLGDVARPNVYNSYSERLTVTEAISLAGDLNVTAQRKNVLLVREINGKREFYHIDLTSKDLFESPYFYLKSNDLIVVQPGKLKVSTLETSGYRNASLIISALSVVVTLAYLVYHK